jgi:DNA invertase Pin-like site-specific DNA recombinase
MVIAYIRADKNFDNASEQLKLIKSYAIANDIEIDKELIDHNIHTKRISDRKDVVEYFRDHKGATLIVGDVWVLSTNMEDLVQMFSCLLKNEYKVHFIKKSVVMSKDSNATFVLGLLDSFRQSLQNIEHKVVGRPKGSKSSSKFDKYLKEIMQYIKEGKNVSEMARILQVSRSSLKDYIESRELKTLAKESFYQKESVAAEEDVIKTIKCPDEKIKQGR